ncbi:MAG: undecaprenyl-diphosphate phosphatase [Bacteroidales bacterium]|nr:undecaprenyl-diphosphate phosphatase [Bacteroidales bacterium]
MEWFEALLLGLVQGLTEFLPVSSSGHLSIVREWLGVDTEGFLDFTVTVHFATVLSTIVVFRAEIWHLLCGLFKFRYNDETDYILKIAVSMIPVGIVGVFFKDRVEALFGDGLHTVAVFLLVTAVLLCLSDYLAPRIRYVKEHRNGISYWQAFVVGLGQALAVAPGLSRSGTTISLGLVSGVDRKNIAQFSFLMVLVPILGEQLLDLLHMAGGSAGAGVGLPAMALGFVAAFCSGLFACRVMVALVRRARLRWFALYCALAAVALLAFA